MGVLLCGVGVISGVGVDQRGGESGYGVGEVVFGVVGDPMRITQA